jgi:broad specificity phosphatase PhoE
MPLTVVYETHSTSLDNEAGIASGHYDVALSPTGLEQARDLGERQRDEGFDAVYCSDLARQRRTAEIAFEGCDLPIVVDSRLRECDYGEWTRRPSAEVEPARGRFVEQPFPGGESYVAVVARHCAVFDEAAERWSSGGILLIGSHAAYVALEHFVNGVPLAEAVTKPRAWQPGWTYSYDEYDGPA